MLSLRPIQPSRFFPQRAPVHHLRFGDFNALKTDEARLNVPEPNYAMDHVRMFTGSGNPALAQNIARYLGIQLSPAVAKKFPGTATYTRLDEPVGGKDVVLIQPLSRNINDNLMELISMCRAAKDDMANRVIAVIPYYGYGRQDWTARAGETNMARVAADMLKMAGADHVISMDFHSKQLGGFFSFGVDQLSPTALTAGYIAKKGWRKSDVRVVAPDEGAVKRTSYFATDLGNYRTAFMSKWREGHGGVKRADLKGTVKDKICIIVDDETDTSGTICVAAAELKRRGARKVIVIATHGVLSDPAIERLDKAPIDEIIVTDTIKLRPKAKKLDKLTQISVASIFGEAIGRRVNNLSVRDIPNTWA